MHLCCVFDNLLGMTPHPTKFNDRAHASDAPTSGVAVLDVSPGYKFPSTHVTSVCVPPLIHQ